MTLTYKPVCRNCGAELPVVATHIVTGLYCDDHCVEQGRVGKRKVRDDPRGG